MSLSAQHGVVKLIFVLLNRMGILVGKMITEFLLASEFAFMNFNHESNNIGTQRWVGERYFNGNEI